MAEKASARILDFTNVKDRGDFNPVHVEPGEYVLKIVSVVDQESKQGNPMWVFGLQFVNAPTPSASRATYPYHCVLDEKSLWKVRGLFLAAGFQVPKSRMKLDPNRIVGRTIGAILEDDEYEGRVRSKVVQVIPANEIDEAGSPASSAGDADSISDNGFDPAIDLDGVDL